MRQRTKNRTFVTIFCTLLFVLSLGDLGVAQKIDRFVQGMNHTFTNDDGEIVADGTFLKVSGGRVVVEEGDGEEVKVLISSLCAEDQEWVKQAVKDQRARDQARKKFQKIMEDNLNSGTDSKIASGLTAIRKLGKNAAFATNVVEKYMGKNYEEKIRYQAFLAYIATKFASDTGMESVFNMVLNDPGDVMEKVGKNPKDFMMSVATFGDRSLDYLTLAAYEGQLIPDDNDPVAPSAPATDLDAKQQKTRNAAVAAIATIPGEDTLQIIFDVLDAADAPEEGEPHASTIKACLLAFGTMAISNDEVNDKLDEFEDDFASQVKSARNKIARAAKSDEDDGE